MSGHTGHTVAAMDPGEHFRAGEVLGRAFHADPLWSALLPNPATRPATLSRMFSAVTKALVAARGVAETTVGFEAVALWLPPGRKIGFPAMLRSGFALPRFVMTLPASQRRPLMAVLRQLEGRRKILMPQAHLYLSAVGVEPDHQREGLGSALLRAGISRADRDAVPIYLETEIEDNVGYYARFGFVVVEEVVAEGLDLPIWLMTRSPT